MGGSKDEYSVKVKGKERIAAVLPLQEHWLPLSNLDLLLPPLDVGVFFCYKKQQLVAVKQQQQQNGQHQHQLAEKLDALVITTNTNNNNNHNNGNNSIHHGRNSVSFGTIVSGLKASLAQALVTYYAFGGEVVTNSVGEPELLCNNRGVDFIEAYADVELRDLQLHNPDQSVERKLVPKKKEGVLCVQVTELKCGGMVLACTFDHRVADAYSVNMFLVSWTEIAKSKPISFPPSFRRSLLSPRRHGYYDAALFEHLYAPISSLPPPSNPPAAAGDDNHAPVNRIYYVAGCDIERMQAEASGHGQGKTRSKLEAFSAYIWRAISKGARQEGKACCRMGIVVNGRSRLASSSPLMPSYFGNVLSIPYGTQAVKDLEAMELGDVANVVHDFLQPALTEKHFLELIDWVEAHRPEPAVARIYCEGSQDEGAAFVISSGRGFPVTEVEFGWGKPVFGSYHFPWGGSAGYVMPMPSAQGGGDWVVYMHLMRGLVDKLEAEAGDIFRPLTSEYLMLNKSDN